MARIPKIYSAKEILKTLEKTWLTTRDIQIVSGTGEAKARMIKQDIIKIVENKGYRLPMNLIPAKELIDYLHLDIDFLREMTKNADND